MKFSDQATFGITIMYDFFQNLSSMDTGYIREKCVILCKNRSFFNLFYFFSPSVLMERPWNFQAMLLRVLLWCDIFFRILKAWTRGLQELRILIDRMYRMVQNRWYVPMFKMLKKFKYILEKWFQMEKFPYWYWLYAQYDKNIITSRPATENPSFSAGSMS